VTVSGRLRERLHQLAGAGRIMPQTRLTESAATVWHEQTSLFLGAERNYQGIRIE